MSDETKMLIGIAGFFILLIVMAITRSELLMLAIVAIVCYVTGAMLHEPYQVITVKPREEKEVEVEEMEVKE